MYRERLTPSLLAELYELEEDAYRLSLREAKRIECGPPAAALRAVAAHANEALEELPAKARRRHVRLGSALSLAIDTLHRLRDVVMDQVVDHEHGYRRALTALHRGIDLGHLIHAAAIDEGDDELAKWCQEWLRGRERLVADASDQLKWFARHPFFSRLPGTALPTMS
jgi:hypothetical protein